MAVLRKSGAVFLAVVLVLVLGLLVAGCGESTSTSATTATGEATSSNSTSSSATTAVETSELILASTTSTKDSGLFDVLIPAFNEAYPQYEVSVVAVGTGAAIKLGQQKDADVLLVHSPADEEKFVAEGYGTERKEVMYNDFIVVGAAEDPAAVKGKPATDALKAIADTQSVFISRGDESGTHKKELALWKSAAVTPEGDWYQSVGQGMGETLRIANEKMAYTLADRGTYLSMKDNLELVVLVEGDEALFNQYGVIPVVGAANPEGAQAFADWIVSAAGQEVIGSFGVEKFGQALFTPNAAK